MNENKIISANPAAKQDITGAITEVNELVFVTLPNWLLRIKAI